MIKKIFLILGLILLLLSQFILKNYFDSKKLVEAIKNEDLYTIEEIIDKNPECINTYPSLTSKGWHSAMNWSIFYPLTEACQTGNLDIIKFLLDNGASLDYNTCHYSEKYSAILQDIVQNRPSSNAVDYIPDSNDEVIKAFKYALENCDHSKVNWMRVLQHSVTNDRIEIVKLLLDQGYCNVNDTSVGMTALMFAARDSNAEMVQLLLDHGANTEYIDESGKTAYDYAVESDKHEIISILENY